MQMGGYPDLREVNCKGGKWMALAQDHVQLWSLVLVVLNIWVLLSNSGLIVLMQHNLTVKSTECNTIIQYESRLRYWYYEIN
jgi:hypothetical protein